jgi:type I restriction enzyme, S subunit
VSKLPPGWALTTIDRVAANRRHAIKAGPFGSALKKSDYVPNGYKVYGQEQVLNGDANYGDYYVSQEHYEVLESCAVRPRDVLVSLVGTVGKSLIVPLNAQPGIINPRLIKISLDERVMLPEYFVFMLQSPHIRSVLKREAHGGTMDVLNLSILRELVFPVAPIAEQVRIVATIEEQFSRLDAGVAALERARQNLKRMQVAVLQAAVEDSLSTYENKFVDLDSVLQTPLANGRSVPDGPKNGYPVLRLTAVRGGTIDTSRVKVGDWTAEEAAPFRVQMGDFLVVRGNGSKHLVGRGGLVMSAADVAYPDTLIRARFDPQRVLPAFAALIWDSRSVRDQIESAARTTAGIYKINQGSLRRIRFPLPTLVDQARILGAAEAQLRVLERTEDEVQATSTRVHKLQSSILAGAFSGELVPQDPSDEPAPILLERIAAERASSDGHRLRKQRVKQVALL